MGRDFRDIAEEHAGAIFTYARYSLRHREDAEDVTQEVLVRLWTHRDAIDPGKVRGWVMQVARNLVIDVARRRQARSAVMAEGELAEEAAARVTSHHVTDHEASRNELRNALQRAIADLNEPYRSIVVMREIQGMSYDEIATGMSMPLGTIKVYLHRARRVLRESVRTELGNDV